MTTVADSGLSLPKKKSLLDKLGVPIHHLDFDFVKKCTDVKELEKIIKILRSKQEGYYPELEACAENQLAALDRSHRLLRHSAKVMTKADLSKEEWNNITSDLLNWKGAVENKDLEIFEAKSRTPNGTLPIIRNSSKGFCNAKPSNSKGENSQRIRSLDYKSWEKFDADEECKKMDLEEEQKQSVASRKTEAAECKKTSGSVEDLAIEALGDISHLSSNEREVMAIREKDIGNEFYNTNKVEDAIAHYSRSIYLSPTVAGLNNRAAAYLRQCAFNKALDDLNRVLEMDPMNVKARFRRAQSFQHKNMFREALEDINVVLAKEPNHLVAGHIADQLRESVSKLPKMHKIKIKEKETGKVVIRTITEEEMLNDYKNENFVEVNDWGFPRIMCNCNGKHSNDPGIRHEEHMRYQHLAPHNKNTSLKKPEKVQILQPENYAPIALPAKKVEILEVAKSQQETEKLPGKKLEILEVEKGSQENENGNKDANNSCVVADMRTARSAKADCSPVESQDSSEKSGQMEITRKPVDVEKIGSFSNQRSSCAESLPMSQQQLSNTDKSSSNNDRSSGKKTGKIDRPHDESDRIENEKSPGKRDKSPKVINDKLQKNVDQSSKHSSENDQKHRDLSQKTGNDKSQKTNKNSLIKDISSIASSSRTVLQGSDSLIPDRVKGVKTDKNSRLQDNRTVNGHVDNKMELATRQPCGCLEVFNKFQFKKEWSVLSGPKALERKAELLRSICPKHLVRAFGNSWETEMLVDVFECLRHHFRPSEQQRVAEYLKVVPQLDRFSINAMFLTPKQKSLVQELVKNYSAHLDSSTVSAFT